MGIVEGILYTIWRGIAIGIIISAPMGPVGILCVQRTLDKGRRTGLYTGVGAAISDLIYCLLTGFGLSFIEEFLERNSNIIQLAGSVVLIGFGLYLFKSNPSRQLRKPSEQQIPAGRNILNGFLFTFSNPLIIFLIIGLFARFNFLLPEIKFYHYIIGYLAIFAGALGWWYFVTYFVDKVRAHFNLRSMWLVNKIIGSVIFLFAIVGIFTAVSGLASATRPAVYMNSRRGFEPFRCATDSMLVMRGSADNPVKDMISVEKGTEFKWEFRTIFEKPRTKGSWGIRMKRDNRELEFIFTPNDNKIDETYTSPHIALTVKDGGEEILTKKVFRGLNMNGGENAFRIVCGDSGIALYAGNKEYKQLFVSQWIPFYPDSVGLIAYNGSELRVPEMSLTVESQRKMAGNPVIQDIETIFSKQRVSEDKLEGEWAIFDRTLDDDYLRMGGDYRLAILKDGDCYNIHYISGAEKNPDFWEKGMYKGKLTATPFNGVYDAEWLDASGKSVGEVKAQYEDSFLRLIFTDMSSELRLGKIKR